MLQNARVTAFMVSQLLRKNKLRSLAMYSKRKLLNDSISYKIWKDFLRNKISNAKVENIKQEMKNIGSLF